jgi:hypothetical protein
MRTIQYTLLLLILTASTLSSCKKFLDVNENPNEPGAPTLPLAAKFPAALVSTVNQETLQLNQIGAFFGGYWGTNNQGNSSFFDLKTYNGPGIRNQRGGIPVWENGYNNILYFQLIKEEAETSGDLFYSGASKIMQGMIFLRLVDVYNNIPFDEAAKGTDFNAPRYEDGKTVYQKAVNLISEGINEVKGSPEIGARPDDILFRGNRTLWAKFGNTLKLRALIRQSEAGEQAYIESELSKITQEGSGYLGAGENAYVDPGYQNSTGKLNPFWENYYRNVQGDQATNHHIIRPTEYLIEQYSVRNDPRLEKLYVPVEGSYRGVVFGNPDAGNPAYDEDNTSAFRGPAESAGNPSGLFKRFNQPSVLLSSFESLFLQAEAAQRGWIPGAAKSFYENAIRESFLYVQVPVAAFDSYNAQASVNFDNASDKIERIIGQKWLSLNSISSIEAWNDYRRLGLPDFPGTAASGINGRPLRFMYPETERGTNGENVAAQGSDLMLEDRVWWDKN